MWNRRFVEKYPPGPYLLQSLYLGHKWRHFPHFFSSSECLSRQEFFRGSKGGPFAPWSVRHDTILMHLPMKGVQAFVRLVLFFFRCEAVAISILSQISR